MSISWTNIFIKKQHNTTRLITLQTRTTHALSTANPETGGFLHKKLTATEETGAKPTGGHEDSNKSIYESADKRTTSCKYQEREDKTGAKDGTEQGPKGANRRTGAGSKGASARRTGAGISDRPRTAALQHPGPQRRGADSVIHEAQYRKSIRNAKHLPSRKASRTIESDHPTCGPPATRRRCIDVLVLDTVRVQDRS
jgi:hypothetical protein